MRDLQQLNAPQEVIDDYRQQQRRQSFPVLPENWDALGLFLRLQTQWRHAPNGQLIGLDYPGVDIVLKRSTLNDSNAVFEQIQTLESAYLNALGERHG